MSKITKILLLLFVANGLLLSSWADRGVGKKKAKISLNLNTPRSTGISSFGLKAGISYKGNRNSNNAAAKSNNSFTNVTTVSYKKGNTIYIIPYKQKVVVPDVKPGYTGVKLILKSTL